MRNQAYQHDVPINSISPHPNNPHIAAIAPIEASIALNGFYGAVVCQQSTRRILVGEHRWRAAKQQNATVIPVIWVDADDSMAMRIMVADNRTSDLASYDVVKQAQALHTLISTAGRDRLAAAGYSSDEYSAVLKSAGVGKSATAKRDNEPSAVDSTTLKITIGLHAIRVDKERFKVWFGEIMESAGSKEAAAQELKQRLGFA